MSDTTTTIPVVRVSPPVASDLLTPPQPELTPEVAAVRRVEFLGDAARRQGVMQGDPKIVAEWKKINAALVPKIEGPEAEQRQYAERQAALAPLKMSAGPMDPLFWDGVATRAHVSLAERETALQMWAACKRDRAWVEKCIAGDLEANALKMRINGILAAPVGTPEQVEQDRLAGLKRVGLSK
jgi:hypothetical protein